MMIEYLKARIVERWTWIGLGLVLFGIGLLWIFRDQVVAAASATVIGATLSAVPDRLLRLTRKIPTAGLAVPLLKETKTMSTFVTTLEAAALEGVKTAAASLPEPEATLARAIVAAAENPTAANVIAALIDAAKVVEDLRNQIDAAKAAGAAAVIAAQPQPQS